MCTDLDVGFGLLQRWKDAGTTVASGPLRALPWRSPSPSGSIAAHGIWQHRHLGEDAFYVAHNLFVDPRKQLHIRAGWRGRTVMDIQRGALRVACRPNDRWRTAPAPLLVRFIKQGIQFGSLPRGVAHCAEPTLFVTRDGEYNVFHSMADLVHAFLMKQMFGYDRIVFFDDFKDGPFLPLWQLLSPKPPVSFHNLAQPMLMETALFSPPGGCCFLWKNYGEAHQECRIASPLLQAFRSFVLQGLGLAEPRNADRGKRRITLIRRNVRHDSQTTRRIVNEGELLAGIAALGTGIETHAIDFAELPVREQIRIAAESDVLLGMHGAGLTHAMWLRPSAALVELFPSSAERPACFGNIATWVGTGYDSWTNEKASEQEARMGLAVPAVRVDVEAVTRRVARMLQAQQPD